MHIFRKLIFVVTLLFVTPSYAAPLSDSAAKTLINRISGDDLMIVPIGNFTVVNEITENYTRGILSWNTFQLLQAAQSAGFVNITRLPAATMGPMGMPALPPHIHSQRINISLTDAGKSIKIELTKNASNKFAFIKKYEFKGVTRIVKNEPLTRGADELRLVLYLAEVKWTDAYVEILRQHAKIANLAKGICANCGEFKLPVSGRKGRILFKYDPFKQEWHWGAADIAAENEEFSTNEINKMLKQY